MFVELDEDGSGQARGGDGWESKVPWRPQKIAGLMIPRLLNPYFCGGGMLGGGWLISHTRNTQNATMLAGWGKFWSFARLIHYKATTWVRLLSFNPVCQIYIQGCAQVHVQDKVTKVEIRNLFWTLFHAYGHPLSKYHSGANPLGKSLWSTSSLTEHIGCGLMLSRGTPKRYLTDPLVGVDFRSKTIWGRFAEVRRITYSKYFVELSLERVFLIEAFLEMVRRLLSQFSLCSKPLYTPCRCNQSCFCKKGPWDGLNTQRNSNASVKISMDWFLANDFNVCFKSSELICSATRNFMSLFAKALFGEIFPTVQNERRFV